MRSLFAELRRRNVLRAGALYAAGAWLLVQVATQVFPFFHIDEWVVRWIVIAAIIGFPFAMVLSWFYELTPEGFKRDEEVAPESSIALQTRKRLDRAIIVVLSLAVVLLLANQFVAHKDASSADTAKAPDKSIAVLPFENLSSDKDNAYFADGIQDEILTRLAKIGALKVISRTSTLRYASRPDNLPQIADQLGVANILEGSVQKAADAVRINVQLIRADGDSHLWAETYDRKLDNIFGVESEVAAAIADALNAKLSGAEKTELARKPTQNPEAYDAYLHGIAFQGRIDALMPNTLNAVHAFEDAVRLDPGFALAWAQLSREHSFAFQLERTQSRRDAARSALDTATHLAPDLVETRLADAFYRYWVERDYEGAKTALEAMDHRFPNHPWVPYTLAAIARRQGDWPRSRELFARAVELDPQNVFLLGDAARDDIAMRDTALAKKHTERALELSPKNPGIIPIRVLALQMEGDIAGAESLLANIQPEQGDANLVLAVGYNAIFARSYAPAIAMLKAQLENSEALGTVRGDFENLLGDLQRHAGDAAAATDSYAKARASSLAALREQPDNPQVAAALSWAQAGLGQKAAALEQARRSIALLPDSKDAFDGPAYEEALARIQARFGDNDDAIVALRHLLGIFYGSPPITPALLRIDPDWDNLRSDPRFVKLLTDSEAAMKARAATSP